MALRLAKRLVGDPDVAEEVMQESLCRLLERWETYRGEAKFSTWMMQIVVNVARERRRRPQQTREIDAELAIAATEDPLDQMATTELKQKIFSVVDRLPDRQREVAMLRFGEGLGVNQVAAILRITEANVYTCMHLARKRIAQAIGVNYVERK